MISCFQFIKNTSPQINFQDLLLLKYIKCAIHYILYITYDNEMNTDYMILLIKHLCEVIASTIFLVTTCLLNFNEIRVNYYFHISHLFPCKYLMMCTKMKIYCFFHRATVEDIYVCNTGTLIPHIYTAISIKMLPSFHFIKVFVDCSINSLSIPLVSLPHLLPPAQTFYRAGPT